MPQIVFGPLDSKQRIPLVMADWRGTTNITWNNSIVQIATNPSNTRPDLSESVREDSANEMEENGEEKEEALALTNSNPIASWTLSKIGEEFFRIQTKLQNGRLLYQEIYNFQADFETLEVQKRRLEASLRFIEQGLNSAATRLETLTKDNHDLRYVAEKTTFDEHYRHNLYSEMLPVVQSEDIQKIRRTLGISYKTNAIERAEILEKVIHLKKQWQSFDLRIWKISECQAMIRDAIYHLYAFYPPSPPPQRPIQVSLDSSASVSTNSGDNKQTSNVLSEGRTPEPRFVSHHKGRSKKRKFDDVLFGDNVSYDTERMMVDTGYDGDCDQSSSAKRTKRMDNLPVPIEKDNIENNFTLHSLVAL